MGSSGLARLFRGKQDFAPRETRFRPQLRRLVKLGNRGRARRKHHPRLLRRGEDMNVRRQPIGLVERADADKFHSVAGARVMAPDRDVTLRAARDLLSLAAVRRRCDDFDVALEQRDAIAFDHRIERERGSGLALAPAEMTAMHEHRVRRHAVAHAAAGATAVVGTRIVDRHRSLGSGTAFAPTRGVVSLASNHAAASATEVNTSLLSPASRAALMPNLPGSMNSGKQTTATINSPCAACAQSWTIQKRSASVGIG